MKKVKKPTMKQVAEVLVSFSNMTFGGKSSGNYIIKRSDLIKIMRRTRLHDDMLVELQDDLLMLGYAATEIGDDDDRIVISDVTKLSRIRQVTKTIIKSVA